MTKSKTLPLKKEHAIQEVIFSLQLKQQLSVDTIKKLFMLKEVLKESFPHFEELRKVLFQFDPAQPSANALTEGTPAGIALKNAPKGQAFDWSIYAEQNLLVVTCLDYKGWEKTWPKARTYLETLAEQVLIANSIEAVNLQYTNIFLAPKSENYDLGAVFNEKSFYLADNIKKAGAMWHQFQGWMEDDTRLNHRYLNNLNLATSVKNEDHVTTITFLRQAQVNNLALNALDELMNTLHTDLKKILINVLSAKMASEIGLKNS